MSRVCSIHSKYLVPSSRGQFADTTCSIGLIHGPRHLPLDSHSSQDYVLLAIFATLRPCPLDKNHLLGWHRFCCRLQRHNRHLLHGCHQPVRVSVLGRQGSYSRYTACCFQSCCRCANIRYPVCSYYSSADVACKAFRRACNLPNWNKVGLQLARYLDRANKASAMVCSILNIYYRCVLRTSPDNSWDGVLSAVFSYVKLSRYN